MSSLEVTPRFSARIDCPSLLGGCLPIFVAALTCCPAFRLQKLPCLPRSLSPIPEHDTSSSFSSPNLQPNQFGRSTMTAGGDTCTCRNRHFDHPAHLSDIDEDDEAADRSTLRLSDIYDRMFPSSALLTNSPRLLSPIETVQILQPIPFAEDAGLGHDDEAPYPDSSSNSLDSTSSLSSPLSTHPTEDLGLSPSHRQTVTSLTQPNSPYGGSDPDTTTKLAAPFSPSSLPLPKSPMSTISSLDSSPVLATPATHSSLLVHTPATPLYNTTRVFYSSPRKGPVTPQQSVYTFPVVPGATISPRAFSISTCNDWIQKLSPPYTPGDLRNGKESFTTIASFAVGVPTESQTSDVPASFSGNSVPRDSYELKRHQDRLRALSDWNAIPDMQASEEDLTPGDGDMQGDEPDSSDCEEPPESLMTIPELDLPDWTLDIPHDLDDLYNFVMTHSPELENPSPLRGILRLSSDSTSEKTIRSVKWAPEESLRQTKYISVDGSVLGLDNNGYPRPLTPEEERSQAEYERARTWI